CSSVFFQAEDGIRDFHVTGVQTCALPISTSGTLRPEFRAAPSESRGSAGSFPGAAPRGSCSPPHYAAPPGCTVVPPPPGRSPRQIGRASCREKGENSRGAVNILTST